MTVTRLSNLPADWRVEPLGNLASEQTKRNPNLQFTRDDVLTVDNQLGLIRSDRKLGDDFSRYKIVGEHCFAYNPMRLNVGSIGLWEKPEPALVSPDYIVFECNKEKLLPQFLDFFRRTPGWRSQIQQSGQGSIRIRYYFWHIAEFVIPVPSLSEQRAIAHVLRTVQRAKEATEKVITATRQLKQSLMRHLFTYGPVPFDQADRVKLKETEIGQIPEHWALVPLADVATVKTSTVELSRLKKAQVDNGQGISVLFLKVSDMNLPGNNRTISVAQEHADVRKETISSLNIVPPGSVVLPKRGAAIATNKKRLTGKHCILDPNILAVIPGDQVDGDYLFGWFEQVDLRKITDATTLPQLNKKDIEPLLFPMPLLVEQQVIARMLRTCDTKIEAEETRREALDTLFQSLLHHLMAGKVRVPLNAAIV